uniref:RBR-type E3 ubiquitin transferase n=1 Tax=Leersia perrieri TaxID=77586 RepID=A0A0D9XGP2_9ORYZ
MAALQLAGGSVDKLSAVSGMPATEFDFLAKAYQQIAEGRRLLRWTYAYGYYYLAAGDGDDGERRRTMVECAQGEAERWLEKLHECAENERKDLEGLLTNPPPNGEGVVSGDDEEEEEEEKAAEMVVAYREKLAGLTGVCEKFFRNLLKPFQDGFDGDDRCETNKRGRSDEDDDYFEEAEDDGAMPTTEKPYAFLTDDVVRTRQEEDITNVSDLLSINSGFAFLLLRRFRAVIPRRAPHPRRRRPAAVAVNGGVRREPAAAHLRHLLRPVRRRRARSAWCGAHFYCVKCWRGYIHVEDSSGAIKWCPAAGCSLAVAGDGATDAFCACGHAFCISCGEDAHRPVSCSTVRLWLEKNVSESETATWLLAHTKHCPKCRRPIEKNLGCMHMTCRAPCLHQFCWICLEPWAGHNCASYRAVNADAAVVNSTDDEIRREAKASLDRYIYHYERWDANLKSLHVATRDMAELEAMARAADVAVKELRFVTEAYEMVGEGRRVLGWAHAYGYYLDPVNDFTKRQLFEYLQEDANASLERLRRAGEGGALRRQKGRFRRQRRVYRDKLSGLTKVTRNYFGNLVRAFETDLAEVSSSS